MDEHIIEALGRTRVVVRDGKVVEVGEPKINYCPIFDKNRGIKEITSEAVQKNIEFRIKDFGMCTPERKLRMKDFLSFGVSETLSTLLDENMIDCAVIVSEGCGTVILADPEFVQGMAGRISAFISTTPITKIIETIGPENVLNPETAEINQIKGVLKAIDMGYRNIAVSVVSAEDTKKLREIEKENEDVNIYIFAAHVTEMSEEDAKTLFDTADVITSCASKYINEVGKEREVFKVGASVPIFGATEAGEKFLKTRLEKIGGLKDKAHAKIPDPLI
ncbi:methanogenesis marker 8 protein [Methanobacterium aggregans]|uniref:methanogenesis marker 8 protein n=1 Tax=Methanobacterium aggregans TaxID=1615586 RepID=UPI001AE12574|nr:methanogenesis marker 8 protein [Methanobacterium aggregans]MBP2045134.1 putative methanogenesis marker protein 8 [Methanobacterium aggregans]